MDPGWLEANMFITDKYLCLFLLESVINGQCLVNLCGNGGTCSAYMNTYRCHCANGYQGKHCEGKKWPMRR